MLAERTLPNGVRALVSTAFEDEGFLAAFTERAGGRSEGVFGGLNLGFRYCDDPAVVAENRRLVREALGVGPFACPQLVHRTWIAPVGTGRAGAGFDRPEEYVRGADGLVTRAPGRPLAVMAADCLMVALVDPATGRVAAVHAGWRGLAAGIVHRAVSMFDRPDRVLAAIGPAIGADHYEVGPEVPAALAGVSSPGAVTVRRNGRTHVDLAATAERVLDERGVRKIERAELCTACWPARFYSYRRDGRGGWQGLVVERR
jgi:YfiH family protein